QGETLGLVGESGCGKSTLGRLVMQLLPVTSGKVFLGDLELTGLRGERLRQQRRQMQIIFQDPFASLDPRMTIGDIIAEPLVNFGLMRGRKLRDRVQELLRVVGLNPNFNNRYPHEFSGGQRQRIGVARALALNPKLIVCHEELRGLGSGRAAGSRACRRHARRSSPRWKKSCAAITRPATSRRTCRGAKLFPAMRGSARRRRGMGLPLRRFAPPPHEWGGVGSFLL